MCLKEFTARELAGFTTGKLSTLVNHLLRCDFCPESVKKKAQATKNDGDESDDGVDSVPTTTTSVQPNKKRVRADSAQANNRVTKQQKFTVVSAKAHSFPPTRQKEFEQQLLRAIISAGWSFNSISDPEVQTLFREFIPSASVPTRQKLSNQILTCEIDEIHANVKHGSKGAYATIQCDGWKDISKKHLVAFLYTANHEASVNSIIFGISWAQLTQTILGSFHAHS